MHHWSRYIRAYLREDFTRTQATDGRVTLTVWRLGQSAHEAPGLLGFALRRLHGLIDFCWTRAVVGAELPRSVPAGPGVNLHHAGRGVILHPSAQLGARATIFHRVTVGVRGPDRPPVIGDNVYLGSGCSLLGPLTIGDKAVIGAGAVVLGDVPEGRVAVGVPARLLPPRTSST